MEDLILHISKFGVVELILFFVGAFATATVKFISRFFSKQEFFTSIHDIARLKNILYSLGQNQVRLDANSILVTRVHNGSTWLNGKHRFKLSVQKSLTVFEESEVFFRLKDADIEELEDILLQVDSKPYDIISVCDLQDSFQFKKVLKRDGFTYIVLFKIEKNKKILGYIWFLFKTEIPSYDKKFYSEILRVCSNIAEEFA